MAKLGQVVLEMEFVVLPSQTITIRLWETGSLTSVLTRLTP